MADAKKPQLEKITTPRGVFVWPHLTSPDTKFEAKGQKPNYHVGIRLSPSDAKAAALIAKITKAAEDQYEATRAELGAAMEREKGDKKVKAKSALTKLVLRTPIKADVDDEGNETGTVVLSAKMNASFVNKKGETVHVRPKLFDAMGEEIPAGKKLDIWGGSEGKISAQIYPYYNPATGDAGVSLRLAGAQIIVLRSGGGARAEDHGFGAEEGGFDASGLGNDEEPVEKSSEAEAEDATAF